MRIIGFVLCLIQLVFSSIAPEYPEPRHHFDGIISQNNDSLNYVFNGRNLENPSKATMSIAHQNREWDYQWLMVSATLPTSVGILSTGASVYGNTNIPITDTDSIAPYVSSYSSDTFNSIYLQYQPILDAIDLNIIMSGKYRKLITISASQLAMDVDVSSPYVLNKQIGVRTTNLISSSYKWSTGKSEQLAKYIGVYYIQPIQYLYLMVEYDHAINYSDMSIFLGHILFSFDESLNIFSTYRTSTNSRALSFGTRIELSPIISLDYISQTETYDYGDISIHSISIGVTF